MRTVFRIFLVLLLLAVAVIGYRGYRRSQPSFYLERAESAKQAGDYDTAVLSLLKVTQNWPEDPAGHQQLAETLLAAAQKENPQATYASEQEAQSQLAEAANLKWEAAQAARKAAAGDQEGDTQVNWKQLADADLQKQLLESYLDAPAQRASLLGSVGKRVLALEPENKDALLSAAFGEQQSKSPAMRERLAKITQEAWPRVFSALLLQFSSFSVDEALSNQTLEQAERLAADDAVLSATLKAPREMRAMFALLQAGIARAGNAATAEQRGDTLVHAAAELAKTNPDQLGAAAEYASRASNLVNSLFPPVDPTLAPGPERTRLTMAAGELQAQAIKGDKANALVYHEAAFSRFNARDYEGADGILTLAFAALKDKANPGQMLDLHRLAARNSLMMRDFDQALRHVDVLVNADKELDPKGQYAGWGHLIHGGVAASQGRHEKALREYQLSKRSSGDNVFVRLGIAASLMALGKWEEALPYLQQIEAGVQADSDNTGGTQGELDSMKRRLGIDPDRIQWGQLQARLAMDDWDEAQKHLLALQNSPLLPKAQAACVLYLWRKQRRDEAKTLLAKSREANPQDVALLQVEAAMLRSEGKSEQATELLAQSAAAAPDDLQRGLLMVRDLLSRGEREQALKTLDQLAEANPQSAAPLLMKADLYLRSGETDDAMQVADELRKRKGGEAVADLISAYANIQLKDYEAASEQLEDVAENQVNQGGIGLIRSQVAQAQGEFGVAVDTLGTVLDVDAVRQRALQSLRSSIVLFANQEGADAAVEKVEQLLKKYPQDVFLVALHADMLLLAGRPDDALREVERLEVIEPDTAMGPLAKSTYWGKRGRLDRALPEIRRALEVAPDSAPCHVMAARLYFQTRDYAEALEHATRAWQQRPADLSLFTFRLATLLKLQRGEEALKDARQLLQRQPQQASSYTILASVLDELDRRDESLATIQQGREALPDNVGLAAAEVRQLCQLNRGDEARQVTEQFLKDHRTTINTIALGEAFYKQQRFDDAEWCGLQAAEVATEQEQPGVELFLGNLALVRAKSASDAEARKRQLEAARHHFEQVQSGRSGDFVSGNNLAWLLAKEFNEIPQAVEVVERTQGKLTVAQMPVNFVDTLAEVYRRAGRLDDAEAVLQQSLTLNSGNPLLLFQLGMVLYEQQKFSAARDTLEQAINQGLSEERKVEAERLIEQMAATSASRAG